MALAACFFPVELARLDGHFPLETFSDPDLSDMLISQRIQLRPLRLFYLFYKEGSNELRRAATEKV